MPGFVKYMLRHRSPFSEYIAEYSMALMYYVSGEYLLAKQSAEKALELMQHPEVSSVKYNVATYTIYARILLAIGEEDKAVGVLDKAIEMAKEEPTTEMVEAYLMLGDYYASHCEYERAISLYKEIAEPFMRADLKLWMDQLYKRGSEVFERMGKYEEALKYYKQYHQIADSSFNLAKEYSLSELRVKYKVEQYENQLSERQIEILQSEKKRQFWFLLFLLSTLCTAGVWIYLHNKNRYYERIVRQYRENLSLNRQNADLNRQIRRIGEDQQGLENRYAVSSLSRTKGEELFSRLEEQMQEHCLYRDSELTIDRLASVLQTNRSYLSQVINEYGKMNYSRYINHFRMTEATERLSDPEDKALLKALALDLGFKSATAFSKAFAEETGVSPSVYRKKALEMDKRERNRV